MLDLPVYNEVLIRCLLVTDWTNPGRLLFIHLDIKSSIEALKVRARYCSARDCQPHLAQLEFRKNKWINYHFFNDTALDDAFVI